MKGKITFILIGLIIVAGIVAAVLIITKEAALNGPCGTATVEKAAYRIQVLLDRWSDANQLASSTSRIALSGPIAVMQSIRREFEVLEVPDCMKSVTYYHGLEMDSSIKGYLAFMSDDLESVINGYFSSAKDSKSKAIDAMLAVYDCAPNCP